MNTIRQIEISFPAGVELTREDQKAIMDVADAMCRRYEAAHPGRVMWPAGIGQRIVSMPITAEDDANGVPMEFDEEVFSIDCSERADYKWPCARCGVTQGDHKIVHHGAARRKL
jgi:hypothetical protein